MKKLIFSMSFLLPGLILFSQPKPYEIIHRNITVPLRVFEGNRFIENLTIQDLELYDEAELQKIEALYLINKTKIERREESRNFMPLVSRNFYLLFQIIDYNPKLGEAIDYFFTNVLLPDDTLTLVTPMKNYNLSERALKTQPSEILSKEVQNIIRKDTNIGSSNYRSLMRDLKRLVRGLSGSGMMTDFESDPYSQESSLEFLLSRYRDTLQSMENLRVIDTGLFLKFAHQLKKRWGEKYVFLFYQREFRPEIHPSILNRLVSEYQDQPQILGDLQDLIQFYHRDTRFKVTDIKQSFADASILFNLLFIHKEPEKVSGVHMREQSEDTFRTFSEVAQATGGYVESSQNPVAAFKNASKITESYYLLYYSPDNYKKDGKFRKIEVKVKNKSYRISHRQGYFAD